MISPRLVAPEGSDTPAAPAQRVQRRAVPRVEPEHRPFIGYEDWTWRFRPEPRPHDLFRIDEDRDGVVLAWVLAHLTGRQKPQPSVPTGPPETAPDPPRVDRPPGLGPKRLERDVSLKEQEQLGAEHQGRLIDLDFDEQSAARRAETDPCLDRREPSRCRWEIREELGPYAVPDPHRQRRCVQRLTGRQRHDGPPDGRAVRRPRELHPGPRSRLLRRSRLTSLRETAVVSRTTHLDCGGYLLDIEAATEVFQTPDRLTLATAIVPAPKPA